MNKTFLAMATIASLGMISIAQAATPNEVVFIGAVSAKTCELVPEVNGAVNNLIDLGTVAPSATGTAVAFKFKAVDIADCASIAMVTTMQWSGALGATGLEMTSGTAKGTTVLLASTGATAANITKTTDSAVFTVAEVTAGAPYTATLKAGTVAGNFRTAAAYSVSYK